MQMIAGATHDHYRIAGNLRTESIWFVVPKGTVIEVERRESGMSPTEMSLREQYPDHPRTQQRAAEDELAAASLALFDLESDGSLAAAA
jgi:hypothetical protein